MESSNLSYIVKDSYILIPVLYVIGAIINKTPFIPYWLIPWILLGLGMTVGFFLGGIIIAYLWSN
jgi:hypothetical protein